MALRSRSECSIFSLLLFARSSSFFSQVLPEFFFPALHSQDVCTFENLWWASAASILLLLPCGLQGDTKHNWNVFLEAASIVVWVGDFCIDLCRCWYTVGSVINTVASANMLRRSCNVKSRIFHYFEPICFFEAENCSPNLFWFFFLLDHSSLFISCKL